MYVCMRQSHLIDVCCFDTNIANLIFFKQTDVENIVVLIILCPQVRLKSLEAMNHGGYKLHPIPLTDICKGLLIKVKNAMG